MMTVHHLTKRFGALLAISALAAACTTLDGERERELPADDSQPAAQTDSVDTEEGLNVEECEALDASWPDEWRSFEEEVLRLVNERRAAEQQCGDEVVAPTHPLRRDPLLTCAARQHSMDFAEAGELSHTGTDGREAAERIHDIGYTGGLPMGENVAFGYSSPEALVNGWMNSRGHCVNIMGHGFGDIGVGCFNGQAQFPHACTQKFGAGRD